MLTNHFEELWQSLKFGQKPRENGFVFTILPSIIFGNVLGIKILLGLY